MPGPGRAACGRAPFSLAALFLFFVKVGAVLFGSGYVLLAFLRADLVERWHWLTEANCWMPWPWASSRRGPVFTTATFIGYVLGGSRARRSPRWGSSCPPSSSWR